jgi:hypothetical protein
MADTQPAPIVNEEVLKSPPEEEPLSGASDEGDDTSEPKAKRSKKTNAPVKTREMRLEQNRKAARESRKRKKVLVEELQRSVIFFSRSECISCVHRLASLLAAALTSHLLKSTPFQPMEPSAARTRRWNNSSSKLRPNFKPWEDSHPPLRAAPHPTSPLSYPLPGP